MGRMKELYDVALDAGLSHLEIVENASGGALLRLLDHAEQAQKSVVALKRRYEVELAQLRAEHAVKLSTLTSELLIAKAQLVSAALDHESVRDEIDALQHELVETKLANGELDLENQFLRSRLAMPPRERNN